MAKHFGTDLNGRQKMEKHTEDNAIDLDAISEQYEEKSYWKRLKEMLSGLRMP